MLSQGQLDLISKIYDLPLKPENWQAVLDEFSETVGAYGASVLAFDPIYAEHHVGVHTSNYNSDLNMTLQDYNQRFAAYDQPAATALALMKERGFVADIELRGMKTVEEYLEYPSIKFLFEKLGVNHRAASRLTINGAWSDLVALQYVDKQERISPQQIETGNFFVDHFAKTIELGRAFGVLKGRFNGVLTALDRFHIGIFVLSPNGSVVVKNREADRILDAGDGLTLTREGQLQPVSDGELRGKLKDAISQAVQTAQAQHNRAETLMTLSRRSGEDPYLVEVTPIRDHDEIESAFKGALVFVIDPNKTDVVSTNGMQELYKLTGSESEVCKLLAQGLDTGEVADSRNLTTGTVRHYVRQILQKTGVNSRAQLVRLALTVNLPIDPGTDDT